MEYVDDVQVVDPATVHDGPVEIEFATHLYRNGAEIIDGAGQLQRRVTVDVDFGARREGEVLERRGAIHSLQHGAMFARELAAEHVGLLESDGRAPAIGLDQA